MAAEQQALVGLHRVREQWVTTRTARINCLRGLLREHGLNLPAGAKTAVQGVPSLVDAAAELPASLRHLVASVHEEIRALEVRIAELDGHLRDLAATDPVCVQLQTVPGIGPLAATALVGTVGHIHAFGRGRQFASWLGLTPREYSSGGRRRLGRISKRGDRYLRLLLTHGGRASATRWPAVVPLAPVGAGGARAVPFQQSPRRGGQQARAADATCPRSRRHAARWEYADWLDGRTKVAAGLTLPGGKHSP